MRYSYIFLLLFLFNISACALFEKPDQSSRSVGVEKIADGFDTPLVVGLNSSMVDWYESMASVNFVAVIPARSDIELGEIYLTWNEKEAEKTQDRLQRMVKRQRWESSIVPDEISAQSKDLGLVDLPFISMNVKEGRTLSAMVPSNISSQKGVVSIKPTAGRVESVPLHDLLNWLQDEKSEGNAGLTIKKKYWHNLSAMSVDGKKPVWLYVVSEILYMNSIDIKLNGELNLDLPENVGATVKTDFVEDEHDYFATEGIDTGKTDEKAETKAIAKESNGQAIALTNAEDDSVITISQDTNAYTRALAINEVVEAQGMDNNFGAITKIMFIDKYGVVLRVSLPQPVAIGVRGLSFQVDPGTGKVLRVQSWQP